MAEKSKRNREKNKAGKALPTDVAEEVAEGDGAAHPAAAPEVAYEGDFALEAVAPADFDEETLLGVYRTTLLSRRLDEKMLTLLKQGKGFFHIGCAGHEATQAALGLLSRPGHDWFSFYYRDLCMYLSTGHTAEDVLLHHFAKRESSCVWWSA